MSITPETFQNFYHEAPEQRRDWSEAKLRSQLLIEVGENPAEFSFLNRIRILFWEEHTNAVKEHRNMIVDNLYLGLCRVNQYWSAFVQYPTLVLWIICPLAGHTLIRKEIELLTGLRIFEWMHKSAVNDNGTVNVKFAALQFEAWNKIQDRLHGPVVQKTEAKSLNVNLNKNETAPQKEVSSITSLADLEKIKLEIQKQIKAIEAGPNQGIELNTHKLVAPHLDE